MEVLWSTPEQYFSELKATDKRAPEEQKIQDVKKDDFFPYMDAPT